MSKLLLFIGGAGFLGKSIIQYLRSSEEFTIWVADRAEANKRFIMEMQLDQNEWPNVQFIDIDLTKECLGKAWDNIFTVDGILEINHAELHIFHFASPVGVVNHEGSTFYNAMAINQNVFRFAKFHLGSQLKIHSNFWYASSSELYGLYNQGCNSGTGKIDDVKLHSFYEPENDLGGFRSDYIYQKYLGEKLFEQLVGIFEVKILRLFNIVGKFQDPNKGAFSKFVNNIIDSKPTEVTTSIRCYTKVFELYEYIVDQMNYNCNSSKLIIKNIVNYDFKNSLTGEELYLYIFGYIKKKYPDIDIKLDYTLVNHPNEISVRGSQETLSYSVFCREFGWVIDKIIEQKEINKLVNSKIIYENNTKDSDGK